MFVLRGKIDSDEWSGWFYLDTAGLLALTEPDSLRLLVGLLHMCSDKQDLARSFLVAPKRSTQVWALVGFLVQLCGASFVIDSGLDDYDGAVLRIEL